jgi:hypothetical protein
MTAIFYFLVLLIGLQLEIQTLTDTHRVIKASRTIREKSRRGTLDTLAGYDRNYTFTHIIYLFLVFIGLFSSQWPAFLSLILIGILASKFWKYSPIGRKLDSALSILIILFIIINRYHLHIDVLEFFKGN